MRSDCEFGDMKGVLDVTENQHAVKVLTQKGICDSINCAISAEWCEHKKYDLVLTSNSRNTKHISG